MFITLLLFALQLLSSSLVESSTITPCDESYPLTPSHNTISSYSVNTTEHTTTSYHHSRNLIGIPPPSYNHNQNSIQDKIREPEYYETGEYYAPLCTDGLHIDIRYLQSCNAGACWDTSIGQCTFVCIWNPPSPPPSPRPSPPPSLLKERSEHAISLNIRNLPSDYRINPTLRVSILRYINDKLKADLNELNIDLISVTYLGMIVGRPHTIPMKIIVNSPSDINDFALSYIIQVLKDDKLQIEETLQRLSQEDMDFNNGDAELNIETYKFDDILVGDTLRPTSSPTITKVEPNSAVVVEENTGGGVPWWTWLLVSLAVIICILISCCYMNRSKDEMDEEKEQQLTMYVNDRMYENGSSSKSKSGQASVAASHRTYRTQHRSNRGGDDNMFLGQPIAASRSSQQQSSRQRRQPRKVRGSDQSSRATKKRSQRQSGRRPEEMSTATDPPEEISQALVVHTRKYDDDNQTGADPEGDKISPKKSMYASGALMEEVHRERQEKSARRKPKRRGTIEKLKSSLRWNQKYTDGELEEANDEIVPYIPEPEEEDEQYTERNQSNSSNNNSRKPPRKKSSFGDKLRASFNWRQSQQPFDDPVNDPIFSTSLQTNDLEDCPQIDLEVGSTDSPSILTNRNPGDGDLPPLDDPRRNNLYVRNSDEYEEDREYDQEKKKMKKQKKSKSHRSDRESSKKKKSGSDRRKQGLLSSFTRRKSITWNDGGGSGDEESYNREYERDDGYSSKGS